jgi:hypothetical protein
MEDEFDVIAKTKPSDIGAEFDAIAKSTPGSTKTKQEPSLGKKTKSFLYGAGTGLVSGLGELERFGAHTIPETLGLSSEKNRGKLFGRETIFPTTKEVEKVLQKVGIEPPDQNVSGYRTAGEIIGGFGMAGPRLLRGAGRSLAGTASETGERLARRAEDLGFRVSAAQARQKRPVGVSGPVFGSEANQTLANRLASESTGVPGVNEIDDVFIRNRLTNLGAEYDKLFANQQIRLDPQSIQALQDVANIQNLLPNAAAGVSPAARQSVNNILNNYQQLAKTPGANPAAFAADGPELQRIRSGLLTAARNSPDMATRSGIFDLLEGIDQSIARNHPQIFSEIRRLNPLYRNTVNLEQLMQQGGIRQGNISLDRLGNMLGQRPGSVRYEPTGLDELGQLGRELQMRAIWEPSGRAYTPEMAAAGQAAGVRTGAVESLARLSTPFQRTLQRNLQPPAGQQTAVGTATRTLAGSPATTGTLGGIAARQVQPEEK